MEEDSVASEEKTPEAAPSMIDPGVRTRIDPRTGKTLSMHSASYWQAHEQRRRQAGLSIRQYCDQNDLAISTFRRWSSQFAGNGDQRRRSAASKTRADSNSTRAAAPSFLSMPIRHEPDAGDPADSVRVSLDGGVQVWLTGSAATRLIEAVMTRALRQR